MCGWERVGHMGGGEGASKHRALSWRGVPLNASFGGRGAVPGHIISFDHRTAGTLAVSTLELRARRAVFYTCRNHAAQSFPGPSGQGGDWGKRTSGRQLCRGGLVVVEHHNGCSLVACCSHKTGAAKEINDEDSFVCLER